MFVHEYTKLMSGYLFHFEYVCMLVGLYNVSGKNTKRSLFWNSFGLENLD